MCRLIYNAPLDLLHLLAITTNSTGASYFSSWCVVADVGWVECVLRGGRALVVVFTNESSVNVAS